MTCIAAAIQMTSRADVGENLATATRLIAHAKARGAQLCVVPENFALMAEDENAKNEFAETIPGEGRILTTMREAAQKHGVALVLGGMPEKTQDAKRVHNTCVYVDGEGNIGAIYRKIHLFDVDIPDGARYKESEGVLPGKDVVVADTPWGGLGLSVCYDLRFPELYRALVQKGARMIVVPAAFTLHTGRDHWHTLLRARAIENTAYVIAAGQYGKHTPKRTTFGHSLIVNPWGHVLADAADQEGVAIAELDFAYQDQVRRELPSLNHRRL